ncbi:MAG: hypothetical protein JRH09_16970 [Deltaproteobacteria bacterium]|nr:hypothetical protein [Deltaproteobacteria bacterium]
MQADSEHEALESGSELGYSGYYLDGEDTRAKIVGGPFGSKDKALADKARYKHATLRGAKMNGAGSVFVITFDRARVSISSKIFHLSRADPNATQGHQEKEYI